MSEPLEIRTQCTRTGERAIDLLAAAGTLSRQQIKQAMLKGAVWLRRGRSEQRLRRATKGLLAGDGLALYYDAEVLALEPPLAQCVADEGSYSVWDKPPGLLAQGTRYGDHCSLLYQVARQAQGKPRPALPVHRLDREASGLMLVAHSPRAAAALSKLWQALAVEKLYQVRVRGLLPGADEGVIDEPLDGRPAQTRYRVLERDPAREETELEVRLITGRKHQIRRHFAGLGHPVLGDRRYGSAAGGPWLALRATALAFRCPLTGVDRRYAA